MTLLDSECVTEELVLTDSEHGMEEMVPTVSALVSVVMILTNSTSVS